jgi:hypothetical protein
MQQVADWLEKLGMSEYGRLFAENRIDCSVLPDLTDQYRRDLGLPLGDRLKMLRAIRELSAATPASPETASPEPESQSIAARRHVAPVQVSAPAADVSGERRYLTVKFCDLVGSTKHFRTAGCRGVARFGWGLSGCHDGRSEGDGWSR